MLFYDKNFEFSLSYLYLQLVRACRLHKMEPFVNGLSKLFVRQMQTDHQLLKASFAPTQDSLFGTFLDIVGLSVETGGLASAGSAAVVLGVIQHKQSFCRISCNKVRLILESLLDETCFPVPETVLVRSLQLINTFAQEKLIGCADWDGFFAKVNNKFSRFTTMKAFKSSVFRICAQNVERGNPDNQLITSFIGDMETLSHSIRVGSFCQDSSDDLRVFVKFYCDGMFSFLKLLHSERNLLVYYCRILTVLISKGQRKQTVYNKVIGQIESLCGSLSLDHSKVLSICESMSGFSKEMLDSIIEFSRMQNLIANTNNIEKPELENHKFTAVAESNRALVRTTNKAKSADAVRRRDNELDQTSNPESRKTRSNSKSNNLRNELRFESKQQESNTKGNQNQASLEELHRKAFYTILNALGEAKSTYRTSTSADNLIRLILQRIDLLVANNKNSQTKNLELSSKILSITGQLAKAKTRSRNLERKCREYYSENKELIEIMSVFEQIKANYRLEQKKTQELTKSNITLNQRNQTLRNANSQLQKSIERFKMQETSKQYDQLQSHKRQINQLTLENRILKNAMVQAKQVSVLSLGRFRPLNTNHTGSSILGRNQSAGVSQEGTAKPRQLRRVWSRPPPKSQYSDGDFLRNASEQIMKSNQEMLWTRGKLEDSVFSGKDKIGLYAKKFESIKKVKLEEKVGKEMNDFRLFHFTQASNSTCKTKTVSDTLLKNIFAYDPRTKKAVDNAKPVCKKVKSSNKC